MTSRFWRGRGRVAFLEAPDIVDGQNADGDRPVGTRHFIGQAVKPLRRS